MDCQANFSEVFQQSIKFSLKCTRMLLVSATPFPPILAKFPSILKLIYIPAPTPHRITYKRNDIETFCL